MTSRRPRLSKKMANHWENVAKKLQKFVTMLPRCCKDPLPLIEIHCSPCRKQSRKNVAKMLKNVAKCPCSIFSILFFLFHFYSRATRLYNPLCRSVRRSVHRSVPHTLLFWDFCGLKPHCSGWNDKATSNMTPAHPHATSVAVDPPLFCCRVSRNFTSHFVYWLIHPILCWQKRNI